MSGGLQPCHDTIRPSGDTDGSKQNAWRPSSSRWVSRPDEIKQPDLGLIKYVRDEVAAHCGGSHGPPVVRQSIEIGALLPPQLAVDCGVDERRQPVIVRHPTETTSPSPRPAAGSGPNVSWRSTPPSINGTALIDDAPRHR